MPLILATVLVMFVLARIDGDAFLASIGRTNLVAFLGFAAAFTVALFLADCLASAHVYRRLAAPISLRAVISLRGASYLPSLVNHHLGQAWLTYMIARTCKVPVLRVTGATLFVYATTMACVVGLGVMSLVLAPDRFAWLPGVLMAIGGGAVLYVSVLVLRPSWLTRWRITAPLAEAKLGGHLAAIAWRIPHVVVLFLGTWLAFWFFEVKIPLPDALALVPPLMVVVALPITPHGLGTRDAFAVEVFAGYASGSATEQISAIASATLCWAVALTIVQIPLSLLFVRSARRARQSCDQ